MRVDAGWCGFNAGWCGLVRVDLIKALSLAGRGGSITNRCGAGAGPAYDPRRGLISIDCNTVISVLKAISIDCNTVISIVTAISIHCDTVMPLLMLSLKTLIQLYLSLSYLY